MAEDIKSVLMARDGITAEEAQRQIAEARAELMDRLASGDIDGAYETCMDEFGLEPDYLEDLIG